MTKLCTTFVKVGEELKAVDFSVVSNDHQYGWRNGELHVEGNCDVVDVGDAYEIVDETDIEESLLEEDDDEDTIDTSYL